MAVVCGAICLLLEALAPSHSLMGLKGGWWKSEGNGGRGGNSSLHRREGEKQGFAWERGARVWVTGRLWKLADCPGQLGALLGWRRQDPSPLHSPVGTWAQCYSSCKWKRVMTYQELLRLCWYKNMSIYCFSFSHATYFRSLYQYLLFVYVPSYHFLLIS